MKIYAQLNENNICVGISGLKEEVLDPAMILIEEHNIELLGKEYKEGEFIAVQEDPQPEILNADQVLMLAIADLYQEIQSLRESQ